MEFLNDAAVLTARPNWRDPVKVEWEYKTEIFLSRDGTEQRRALRSKPRRTVEFTKTSAGSAGRSFRSNLANTSRSLSVMEDFVNRVAIQSPGSPTLTTINLAAPAEYWVRVGGGVVVNTSGNQQFRTIVGATTASITLDNSAVVNSGTKVAPVIIGRVSDRQSFRRLTSNVTDGALTFEGEPTMNPDPAQREGDGDFMHHGFPVANFRPNWAETPNESFPQRFDVLDYSYGKTFVHLLEAQSRWEGSATFVGRSRDDVYQAEGFFFRRRGRLGAFYMPTWQRDMELVSGTTEASTSVTVEGVEAFDLFNGSFVYRNIALIASDFFISVGVKSVEVLGGNTVLTLDAPLPAEAPKVSYISWLMMVRFATDQFAVRWSTDGVAEFDFSLVGLFDRFYELNASLDRITVDEDYITFPPFNRKASVVSPTPWIDIDPLTISEDYLLIESDFIGYEKESA